ncbi:2Fe-2S iron-sulfur cluster-binding protein, partial [Psychrobacter sp. 16-Bac2893]
MIHFYLNGQYKQLTDLNPNTTVLEYLRLHERQTDTKEGCGSGDCGACTVMAQRLPSSGEDSSDLPFYTLNACITLLSLMDGHHIMTSAYIADNPEHHPERALLHPAQQAMVECHGSQCGFCTPGFVMTLASTYENHRLQVAKGTINDDLSYDDIVASIGGNLCRCTGYRPIIEAGLAMSEIGRQRDADQTIAKDLTISLATDAMANSRQTVSSEMGAIEPALTQGSRKLFIPKSVAELNQVLAAHPKATIWAGGTDLGLSVTQHLVDHDIIVQLSAIDELKSWSL